MGYINYPLLNYYPVLRVSYPVSNKDILFLEIIILSIIPIGILLFYGINWFVNLF